MAKNFGTQQKDQNGSVISSGTGIKTFDVSSPVNNSPLSYTNTVTTISVPTNAVEIVLRPSTDLRVSEDSKIPDKREAVYYPQPNPYLRTGKAQKIENIYINKFTGSWYTIEELEDLLDFGQMALYSDLKPKYATSQLIKHAYRDWETDRKSTRLNSSHRSLSRMPSSA